MTPIKKTLFMAGIGFVVEQIPDDCREGRPGLLFRIVWHDAENGIDLTIFEPDRFRPRSIHIDLPWTK